MKLSLFSGIRVFACVLLLFGVNDAFADDGFRYPFDQVAHPDCRFSEWSTLDDECKIDMPRIENADYERYKNDFLYQRLYTVLWGATYKYGWDVGQGSHLGIDVATSRGTPVVSIADGTVVQAGWLGGWGNTVTVRHRLEDGSYLFSNYAHLSKISVVSGQSVASGEKLGEVGSTGNSTGNHLHFQIDTTDQSHPYYYITCGAGRNPFDIVNGGLCRTWLENNTIDPIAFLESGELLAQAPTVTKETVEKIKEQPRVVIDQTEVESREEILKKELDIFLEDHTIRVSLTTLERNIPLGGTVEGAIIVKRKRKPFT